MLLRNVKYVETEMFTGIQKSERKHENHLQLGSKSLKAAIKLSSLYKNKI